jgi:FSR family fosmidomycin resistance protein-like MFS transporter
VAVLPDRFDGPSLALLTAGHGVIDFCQGAVPALLPYLIEQHELRYAAAAGFVLAGSLASSIVQPLFGMYADRVSPRWLIPASLLGAAIGLVGAALAPAYAVAIFCAAVSGLGVAAFHPEAARRVYLASGLRRTTGMSYFSVGGTVGFALAPVFVAVMLALLGANGVACVIAPALVLAMLFGTMSATGEAGPEMVARERSAGPPQWHAFLLLGGVIVVRSGAFMGLMSFLALYWVGALGGTPGAGNIALSVLLGSTVIGAILGGRLADHWGRRRLVRTSLIGGTLLIALFGAAPNTLTVSLLLIPLGVVLSAGSSALIVLGQEYLPGRVGVASGVTIGLAVSCGGAAAPLLGLAADAYGVAIVPSLIAALSLVASLLSLGLPLPREHRAVVRVASPVTLTVSRA